MTQITWKNVDAPDFTGALTGVELTNKLLGQAVTSAGAGVDQFQKMKQDAADRAVQGRINALSFDPAGMQQAMLNGTLAGPDEMNMSADMLARLPNQVDSAITGTKNADSYTRQVDKQGKLDAFRSKYAAAMLKADQTGNYDEILSSPDFAAFDIDTQNTIRGNLLGADKSGLAADQTRRSDQRTEEDYATNKTVESEVANLSQFKGDPVVLNQELAKLRDKFKPEVFSRIATGVGQPLGTNVALPEGLLGDPNDVSTYVDIGFNGWKPPETIKTLGDYTDPKNRGMFNKTKEGEIISPFGAYQMTEGTMRQVGEAALGPKWREADLRDPLVQSKLAETLFNTVKGKGDLLSKKWDGLTKYYKPEQIQQISEMSWDEAKGYIWKAEHGRSDIGIKAQGTALQLNQVLSTELGNNSAAANHLSLMTSPLSEDDAVQDLIKRSGVKIADDDEVTVGRIRDALNTARQRGSINGELLSPAMAADFLRNSQRGTGWLQWDDETGAGSSVDWDAFDLKVKGAKDGGLFAAALKLETLKKAQQDLVTKSAAFEKTSKEVRELEYGVKQGTKTTQELNMKKAVLSGLERDLGNLNAQIRHANNFDAPATTKAPVVKPPGGKTPPPSKAEEKLAAATEGMVGKVEYETTSGFGTGGYKKKVPIKPEMPSGRAGVSPKAKMQYKLDMEAYRAAGGK